MAADLAGKVALITGVGRPGQIGHAVAEAAGRAGARLVITDRNATALAERERELASRGVAVRAAAADLATPDGARGVVLEARRAFGGLDVVVNVAGGFFYFGPFPEASPEVLDRELTVNLKTAFFMCQAAIPVLVERGGGAVVNFASIAAIRSLANMAPYTVAKSAVAGLTRALAREFRDQNVRVNAVAPATVRTPENVRQMGADPKTPFVEVADVVHTVLFLASDAAGGITGQIVPVTGKAY